MSADELGAQLKMKDKLPTPLKGTLQRLDAFYPKRPQFLQSVEEVGEDVFSYMEEKGDESLWQIFELLTEPDRIIQFRVDWQDDEGNYRFNHGFRVQTNNALGPYKGGLRFVEGLDLDTLMFLGFEQTFKNALTGLPMGGAKGGADFNPKGKSEGEIRRFCQAFMTQLSHHIGVDRDIPAGDMGVGSREIGYMFHQYKQMKNEFSAVITGKHPVFGGSCIREEATGYGCVYFADKMMEQQGQNLKNKRCAISGAGNVALYTAKKLIEMKAIVVSLSNSDGCCVFEDGLSADDLDAIIEGAKERKRLAEIDAVKDRFELNLKPWQLEAEIAFPCATQNEISLEDAKRMVKQGYKAVIEGANMPCTIDAIDYFTEQNIPLGPSKAVNAGGVAVSGLEISQNRSRLSWQAKRVDEMLQDIMQLIHDTCVKYGGKNGIVHYRQGANVAAFDKLSQALRFSGLF